jgi:hypothetical protein
LLADSVLPHPWLQMGSKLDEQQSSLQLVTTIEIFWPRLAKTENSENAVLAKARQAHTGTRTEGNGDTSRFVLQRACAVCMYYWEGPSWTFPVIQRSSLYDNFGRSIHAQSCSPCTTGPSRTFFLDPETFHMASILSSRSVSQRPLGRSKQGSSQHPFCIVDASVPLSP